MAASTGPRSCPAFRAAPRPKMSKPGCSHMSRCSRHGFTAPSASCPPGSACAVTSRVLTAIPITARTNRMSCFHTTAAARGPCRAGSPSRPIPDAPSSGNSSLLARGERPSGRHCGLHGTRARTGPRLQALSPVDTFWSQCNLSRETPAGPSAPGSINRTTLRKKRACYGRMTAAGIGSLFRYHYPTPESLPLSVTAHAANTTGDEAGCRLTTCKSAARLIVSPPSSLATERGEALFASAV